MIDFLVIFKQNQKFNSNLLFTVLLFASEEMFINFVLLFILDIMFIPSETGLPSSMDGRRTGSTRPSGPTTKWDYVKTFYYDPVKW